MSKPAFRVLLDSNAFSAAHFSSLAGSPFENLCACGRIEVVYAGEMIEETLRAYVSPATRSLLLREWLPTITRTARQLGDDLPSIWHKELVQGRRLKASERMSAAKQRRVMAHLAQMPEDGSWPIIDDVSMEWREGDSRRVSRRLNTLQMRREAAQTARELGITVSAGFELQHAARTHLGEVIGLGMIQKFIAPEGGVSGLFHQWRRSKGSYPYFTQFVENVVYQEVVLMTDHQLKADVNAQVDLDILTHLLRADIVVTNETGFMRRAFNDIWRPRGKVIFTSDEFSAHLRRM
jgi:hypothetical protein